LENAHLDRATLEHLLRHDQDEIQNRLLLHHLAVCPQCRQVGGHLLDLYEEGRIDLLFTPVDVDLALSRRQAPALWAKLEPHAAPRRRALVEDVPRFHSWGLAELLCDRSRETAVADPAEAVELAELALSVAEWVERSRAFHEEWSRDLLAYAWAHLGNARRVLSELRSAQEAFDRARDFLEAGSGGCLPYSPMIHSLWASLACDQRRFREALALLDLVETAHRDKDELHLVGCALVKRAKVLGEKGDLEAAIDALEQAAEMIDEEQEPRLGLCVRHNLRCRLTAVGRLSAACELLPEVQRRSKKLGSPLDLMRLRWAEGRIAFGLGDLAAAEAAFGEVRREFASRGIGYDAALVSLDLALILAREGRDAELRQLSQEMIAIFRSRDIHREALAALALFQQAVCSERITLELVERLADYLQRARNYPPLRFEP